MEHPPFYGAARGLARLPLYGVPAARLRAGHARPLRQKTSFDKGGSACRKTSLCETDSPDTGEVALAPRGERCPEGAEGENLAIARNISDSRTVLSPTACGRSPLAEGTKG